jgi:hypothetical protein
MIYFLVVFFFVGFFFVLVVVFLAIVASKAIEWVHITIFTKKVNTPFFLILKNRLCGGLERATGFEPVNVSLEG